jgi:putative transposase
MSAPDRRAKLDRTHPRLSLRRRCRLLGLAPSGVYGPPRPANDDELALSHRLDALDRAWSFLGSRRLTALLRAERRRISRKRVQRLMRRMGIAALGPRPRTTRSTPEHRIYPYLLRDLVIDRPNQVWCADITFIALGRGFLYLVAIINWANRAVLSWQLSNTMYLSFCLEALEEAFERRGRPEIFNTDSQLPRSSVAGRSDSHSDGPISVAGAASVSQRCDANTGPPRTVSFLRPVERLWRSLKYEEVYLKGYACGVEARAGIGAWLRFYKEGRPHQALDRATPIAACPRRSRPQAA